MIPVQPQSIERALRKTAQLRALTVSLREAKDRAARERLLAQFESFRRTIESSKANRGPLPSPDVLLAGIKACWARGDHRTIRLIASTLPRELLTRQDLLHAYIAAAADPH